MFVSGKPRLIRSVSAVPANCGCGACGGVPAKHVVLMSVCTGHNLHSWNPCPAHYSQTCIFKEKVLCCSNVWQLCPSVVTTIPWNQTQWLEIRWRCSAIGGICLTSTVTRARVLVLPCSCSECPSPLISSVQIHDIISFVWGVHLICETIYVKLLCSCSNSKSAVPVKLPIAVQICDGKSELGFNCTLRCCGRWMLCL